MSEVLRDFPEVHAPLKCMFDSLTCLIVSLLGLKNKNKPGEIHILQWFAGTLLGPVQKTGRSESPQISSHF